MFLVTHNKPHTLNTSPPPLPTQSPLPALSVYVVVPPRQSMWWFSCSMPKLAIASHTRCPTVDLANIVVKQTMTNAQASHSSQSRSWVGELLSGPSWSTGSTVTDVLASKPDAGE